MNYILLAVVAELPTFEASRKFIDDFERHLSSIQVVSCDWSKYPKFEHSFWYNWYLETDLESEAARQSLRAVFGSGWIDLADGAIWNRSESISAEAQPARWAHLYGERWLTYSKVQGLERGPNHLDGSNPFLGVSTDGEITGVYGEFTDEEEEPGN